MRKVRSVGGGVRNTSGAARKMDDGWGYEDARAYVRGSAWCAYALGPHVLLCRTVGVYMCFIHVLCVCVCVCV